MIEPVQRVMARIQAIEAMGRPHQPVAAPAAGPPDATFAAVLQNMLVQGTRPVSAIQPAHGAPWAGASSAPVAPAGFVPPELERYGNGRIPAEALMPIGQGDHRLWTPAAIAFRQMAAHAAADGVTLRVSDSYRSLERQYELAERLGLYRDGGLAAVPGTSDHGWGLSVDLDIDATTGAWLQANGARYGFVADVPGENWHWTYRRTW